MKAFMRSVLLLLKLFGECYLPVKLLLKLAHHVLTVVTLCLHRAQLGDGLRARHVCFGNSSLDINVMVTLAIQI